MMNLLSKIPQYWKAVVGLVAPAAVVIGSAVTPASDGGTHITTAEWVTAIVAAVVTSFGVAVKGNADPPVPPAAPEEGP